MKKKFKISMLLTALAFSLGLSSCKKEWDCECTDSTTGETYTYSLAYLGKVKKSDAKTVCEAGNDDEVSCKVK